MRNGRLRYRDLRDPYTKRYWPFRVGRDPARIPMQWDGSPLAGLTDGPPWLQVSDNASTVNMERESQDPASLFHLYRQLVRLRKATPALRHGTYGLLESTDSDCSVFVRNGEGPAALEETVLVAVNFSSRRSAGSLSDFARKGRLLLSTHEPTDDRQTWRSGRLDLQPDEAIIVSLT